jgi:hypothetical protein
MLNSDFKVIFEHPTEDDVLVGQVWKHIHSQKIVLISANYNGEIRGYHFTGFEVGNFFSFDATNLIHHWICIYNPDRT